MSVRSFMGKVSRSSDDRTAMSGKSTRTVPLITGTMKCPSFAPVASQVTAAFSATTAGSEDFKMLTGSSKGDPPWMPIIPFDLFPGRTETTRAALGGVELFDFGEPGLFHLLDHQLTDLVTPVHPKRLVPVQINEYHLDLAAIMRIYQAGCVDDAHSVSGGQSAARLNEPGETRVHSTAQRTGLPTRSEHRQHTRPDRFALSRRDQGDTR